MALQGQGQGVGSIVLFPFMAQGHIIPFLALASEIQQRSNNTQIIFVNTPLNIAKIRLGTHTASSIRLVELPFCSTDHGLPPDAENTDSLTYPLICRLLEASQSLKPALDQLILDITQEQHGSPPLCIIADMFLGWTVEIANRLNIFHSIFLTSSAYGFAIWSSLWLHFPHSDKTQSLITLPDFPEVSALDPSQLANNLKNADGTDRWSIIMHKLLPLWLDSDAILINTLEHLDQIGLNYFTRRIPNIPVWPIVPCLHSPTNKPPAEIHSQHYYILDWLDNQPPASVLYVSFGSQNTLSTSQLMQLAIGLEQSGYNFIWVVRPPVGFDINGPFNPQWLPDGFQHRITQANKGLLLHKWAPQSQILSHRSTCAFLSHCGWNSVLESLSNGVPIIGWPLASEQFFNSKLLEEETGVCVEIASGNDSHVKHEDITRVIHLVMDGDTAKAKHINNKAAQIKDAIARAVTQDPHHKGSSLQALEQFINTALSFSYAKLN